MKISEFYNNLKQRIRLIKQYKKLGKYVKNKLGFKLMSSIDIMSVKQKVEEYKEDIGTMEYLQNNESCIQHCKQVLARLEKYINYNCTYSVDIKNGKLTDSGYVICDDNLSFKGFVSDY